MKRDLAELDGDGRANSMPLTEAQLHAFLERLEGFVRESTPRERLFLITILARATAAPSFDAMTHGSSLEPAICTELAYSIWSSIGAPEPFISLNPLPVPPSQWNSPAPKVIAPNIGEEPHLSQSSPHDPTEPAPSKMTSNPPRQTRIQRLRKGTES